MSSLESSMVIIVFYIKRWYNQNFFFLLKHLDLSFPCFLKYNWNITKEEGEYWKNKSSNTIVDKGVGFEGENIETLENGEWYWILCWFEDFSLHQACLIECGIMCSDFHVLQILIQMFIWLAFELDDKFFNWISDAKKKSQSV